MGIPTINFDGHVVVKEPPLIISFSDRDARTGQTGYITVYLFSIFRMVNTTFTQIRYTVHTAIHRIHNIV